MDEVNATETNVQAIAPVEDLEAKVAQLEAEKKQLLEEKTNYQAAYLKTKAVSREDEDEEDKIRRIAQETLAGSRLAQIAAEQDALIKKALKENKELKLAQLNKTDIPVSTTTSTESVAVKDTFIIPEQMAQFKSMGKSDKWIENYKRNLQRNTR